MPKKLEVSDVLEDLPTFCQGMVAFAESLEPLPLDELVQVVEDRDAGDILIAAAEFKASMRQVLARRVGLH